MGVEIHRKVCGFDVRLVMADGAIRYYREVFSLLKDVIVVLSTCNCVKGRNIVLSCYVFTVNNKARCVFIASECDGTGCEPRFVVDVPLR